MSITEYADGTDRQTDGRTPDRYITLFAADAATLVFRRLRIDCDVHIIRSRSVL